MITPLSIPSGSSLAADHFREVFGGEHSIAVRAPGRVNLIGEHVDYQGGLVLPAAIDRFVFAAAREIPQAEVRLWTSLGDRQLRISLDRREPFTGDDRWANYVFGVVAKYRDAGHAVRGFEAAFVSDIPVGAGLSSSAALESATARIIESMMGTDFLPVERAQLCQAAEHEWAGVPCGIMDQLAVNTGVAGHALEIDCRTFDVSPIPVPEGMAVVVVNSKVKHSLADGEYGKRIKECERAAQVMGVETLRDVGMKELESAHKELGDLIYRRARHVVSEIERVRRFAFALQSEDKLCIGELMAGSHRSLRDDFEVSCPELDELVRLAKELGATGARMMGGGFGGSTVNLVSSAEAENFVDQIVKRYAEQHFAKVEAFVVNPVVGAKKELIA